MSAPHVHPATHPLAPVPVHGVVQTLPVALDAPTGKQTPVGQSLFLAQGMPVPPAGGAPHVPPWQTRPLLHPSLAQHGSEALPQGPAAPESFPGCGVPPSRPPPGVPGLPESVVSMSGPATRSLLDEHAMDRAKHVTRRATA
jgi:hypothetical protein